MPSSVSVMVHGLSMQCTFDCVWCKSAPATSYYVLWVSGKTSCNIFTLFFM